MLIFAFLSFFISGMIIFISSLPIFPLSPEWGFNPDIIIFGFFILKSFISVALG